MLLRYSIDVPTPELVAAILAVVYPDARMAVDLTPGRGGFWAEGTATGLERVELSTADFRALPQADQAVDLAILDPPHNADAGARSIMGQRYGTYPQADLEPVVRQGVREAWRISRIGALVKVTDAVHGQRLVRMSRWVTEELGEPYETVLQIRRHALVDPRWKEPQLSARNNGALYLCYRRGDQRHIRRRPKP